MNIIDRLFGKSQPTGDPNRTTHSTLDFFTMGFNNDNLDTVDGQAKEGFGNNPYVHRACDIIGNSVCIPDPIVMDSNGKELKNHPLALLLGKKPNKRMSKTQFFKTIGIHLPLYGESFLYPVWTINGITSIEIADPKDVTVITTGDRWNPVSEYIINRGTAGVMHVLPEDMIHIKFYNPENNGARGMSPLVAAKRSIEMQNSIRDWNISTTINGAKTSLIIEVPRTMTKEQMDRMRDQLNANYGGKFNANKGMVLDDGKKASSIGMTAVEMDFTNGQTQCGREIAISMGVPPELLGDSSNKTYSNQQEANKQLVEMTIKPILDTIYDAITIGLLMNPNHPNAYPEVDKITYDPEPINDMTVDKAALYSQMEGATYLTINEKREKLGYDPIDDPMAETPLVNMGLGPLSDVALDDEPIIQDEAPYLRGEGTITENLAQMGQDKPEEPSIVENLAKLGQEEPKTPTFQHLAELGKDSQ